MLKLDNIVKIYKSAGENVTALKGLNISFRKNEFVSILGQSGCGKTTLLNIIGGLDHYTSGDLIINGRSTKEYRDSDWDTYRNHSIGFVFQSYNLIPHQTVLANVELALTISGIGKAERRRRAKDALNKVGLADQMKKRPNQLSGGQMQRVAIARALVNDPDILLADEPTGALDSATSVQVMDLLAEIAREKLVIMVTHNPELAEKYATRTIRLLDGQVVSDTAPFDEDREEIQAPTKRQKKTSMHFFTALSLSLNNLMTKKGRTLLTSFAGSIGIIGIALILSLSSGINRYINQIQEDTLSSYPITIQAETSNLSDMMVSLMGARQESLDSHEENQVYSSTVLYDMLNTMTNAETQTNNLKAFKSWLDQGGGEITDKAVVQYGYDFNFDIYTKDENDKIIKSDAMEFMQEAMNTMYGTDVSATSATLSSSPMGDLMNQNMDVWEELLPGMNGEIIGSQVESQYDLLYGSWPEKYDEVILFVNENNELSDLMLYSLGLMSSEQMTDSINAAKNGEPVNSEAKSWSYEELCGMTFKLLLPAERYQYDETTGTYVDMSATEAGMDFLYNSNETGTLLKVVGIARPSEDAVGTMVSGAIGYTSALTSYAIEATQNTDIVKQQMAQKDTDVITGLPFPSENDIEPTDAEKITAVKEYLPTTSSSDKAAAYLDVMSQPSEEYVENVVSQQMADMTRESIETMIAQQYAEEMGVDQQTISSYIAEMDDETLFSRIREAMEQEIREQYTQNIRTQLEAMSTEQLSSAMDVVMEAQPEVLSAAGLTPFTEEQYLYLYDNYMPPAKSSSTYEENLDLLGYVDPENPSTINIYATTFAEKDEIADRISAYNETVSSEDEITYTDYVALLMSSVTDIISGISYLLIAFVSISLVVSSIMIGIITYISVLERTKEIGILRAMGASKKDVSRVFNAETLIVGLGAGLIGIGVTLLLIIPINAILLHFTGIAGLKATLPVQGGVILVAISALLTIIAGLIPSRLAAKKDPVVALRTE